MTASDCSLLGHLTYHRLDEPSPLTIMNHLQNAELTRAHEPPRETKSRFVFLALYGAGLLGALLAFGLLAEDVMEQEPFGFDTALLTWFAAHQLPWLTALAQGFSLLGSLVAFGVLTLAVYLWIRRRSHSEGRFFALSVLGALALNAGAKLLFARVRPSLFDQLSAAARCSFPSGHTMLSTAFALAFYLVVRHWFPRWRLLVGLGMLIFALGISLSRPYLQVHYPSDILAGWALSLAWVLGLNLWFRRSRYART